MNTKPIEEPVEEIWGEAKIAVFANEKEKQWQLDAARREVGIRIVACLIKYGGNMRVVIKETTEDEGINSYSIRTKIRALIYHP